MIERLQIGEWLDAGSDWPVIDMRSPGEYKEGHIPGAILMPFFSDEERAEVGTLYKQSSRKEALLRGLELVGPKLRHLVEQAFALAPQGSLRIYCWRGGDRSGSVAQLLSMAGLRVRVLEGGYKAYRGAAHAMMAEKTPPLIILAGPTGSGKTLVLQELERQGQQIIDLEQLANHKGSAFGWIAEQPQLSNEQFENLVFEAYRSLDPGRPVWLEDESRGIGLNFIPESLWERMKRAPRVYLELPYSVRRAYLVSAYGQFPVKALKTSFERIRKRLGGQHLQSALRALDYHDLGTAADIALQYYDKAYRHSLERHSNAEVEPVAFPRLDPPMIAQALVDKARLLFSFPSNSTQQS